MDELAGGRRRADSPPPAPLPDELLLEIFLRLPPEPIHLFRASFVSKHWRSLIHDTRFLRHFREFHGGAPPVLGFFSNQQPGTPFFVPTSGAFAVPTAATMLDDDWFTLDCRHGRALLESNSLAKLLVWDLMTGDKIYLPRPAAFEEDEVSEYNGAILCAAGHTDHGDCHLCPFIVAFVFSRQFITIACAYSSETGIWGEITSIQSPDASIATKPTALVGNKLYWLLNDYSIMEFDLDQQSLDSFGGVPWEARSIYAEEILLMQTEDGQLGFAGVDAFILSLWSVVSNINGVVTWEARRVIDLNKFLAPEIVAACYWRAEPVGYAEDADVIFISVDSSIYMLNLKSMHIEEVSEKGRYWFVFPYTSFYRSRYLGSSLP